MKARTDIDSEKQVIEQVVRNSIGWALTKDTTLLYSCFAHDDSLFWFSPESRGTMIGFDNFKAQVERFFLNDAFQAVGYELRDVRINLSRSGDVAWYSCILDDRNTFNGQPAEWLNTRWTGVLEKRDGHWVIVQQHFSFAADAE